MNKFEKRLIEVEILSEIASEIERRIDWHMEYDENGDKMMPTGERDLYRIEAYRDLIGKIEKML